MAVKARRRPTGARPRGPRKTGHLGRSPYPPTQDTPSVWGRIAMVAVPFALGGLLFGGLALAVNQPDTFERRVSELRQQEAERDAEQIVEFTALARSTKDELTPVLEEMAAALPTEGAAEQATSPGGATDKAAEWKKVTSRAVERFANPPSGQTATNVARHSIAAAVSQLDQAVATYALGLTLDGQPRAEALQLASAQRDLALRTWSVGATQLDVINIDAGNGHQHVYLPGAPGSGALTADPAAEGSTDR